MIVTIFWFTFIFTIVFAGMLALAFKLEDDYDIDPIVTLGVLLLLSTIVMIIVLFHIIFMQL